MKNMRDKYFDGASWPLIILLTAAMVAPFLAIIAKL